MEGDRQLPVRVIDTRKRVLGKEHPEMPSMHNTPLSIDLIVLIIQYMPTIITVGYIILNPQHYP